MATVYCALLTLMLLTAQCPASRSATSVDQETQDEALAQVTDDFVHRLLKCRLYPALTLAVVKDGRVLLSRGYGNTSIKEPRPVTSQTHFAIGSLTKAFTATLVANWVHRQKKINLDTPIQSFYPDFKVTDELRSSSASLRDLLSHRMNVPDYYKAVMMGFPLEVTRDALMKRLEFMPSHLSFRERFFYNNYMYALAAHVVEKMSGRRSWEELVRDTLLLPLNMTSSGFVSNTSDFSSFALPCAVVNGSIVDLSTELFKCVAPLDAAGAIYSNADDMAKWMNLILSRGRAVDGRLVVDPEVIQMTLEPGMLANLVLFELTRPRNPVSHVHQSYNMGWSTAFYRGYRSLYHTGLLSTHRSVVSLYPDIKAGIYASINAELVKDIQFSLLNTLMYFVSDQLLNEAAWLNKSSVCPSVESLHRTKPSDAPHLPNTSADNYSSHLSEFVGNYSHKFFGRIEIYQESIHSKLVFRFGRFGRMNLTQVSDLDFRGRYFGPWNYLNYEQDVGELVRFLRRPNGAVGVLLYSMRDVEDDFIQFARDTNQGHNLAFSYTFAVSVVLVISFT